MAPGTLTARTARRLALAALLALAVGALAGPAAQAAPAPASPTPVHVTMTTKVGPYTVTITASRETARGPGALVVYLRRGTPARDEQTHAYAFTLPAGAVAVDSRVETARVRARLGAFGTVDLRLTGRGATTTTAPLKPCSGPATQDRAATVAGTLTLTLGALGTVRRPAKARLDRLVRRGVVRCPSQGCRVGGGTLVGGVTVDRTYVALQSDGTRTYVFATVSEQPSPGVSVQHTRFALGGALVSTAGTQPGERIVELTGSGPVTGSLRFAGIAATEPVKGCAGQTVTRLSGRITGSLLLDVHGLGPVTVAGDGSATAPIGTYREIR